MKFEKRSGGGELPQEPEVKDRKPVVVYIMILFIAAFLLMALSFFMHQRSNTEALGQLQSSVSAMQEAQETQEHVMQLQKELENAQETIQELENAAAETQTALAAAEKTSSALLGLYRLQQQYLTQDYDACRETIAAFEAAGQAASLPASAENGLTSPAARYQQLKEAVEALPNEEAPETENKP
ncbi:MAG: hypothetical protein HFF87_06335 [Oscillibacter sp.]|jgi:chromosome segregation ATPase|nr:hypothetical protein [Oscillibacter sp.]